MWKKTRKVLRIIFIIGFVSYIGILFLEAKTPGTLSAFKSNKVALAINDVADFLLPSLNQIVEPESITLDVDTDVYCGQKYHLTPEINPPNTSYKGVTYSSSNQSIATINQYGDVFFRSVGVVEITLTLERTSNFITKTFIVHEVDLVAFHLGEGSLYEGEAFEVVPQFTPSNITNTKLTYKSFDESILTVSESGIIHGIKPGLTIVKATHASGLIAYMEVTVLDDLDNILPTKLDTNIGNGSIIRKCWSRDCTAEILPIDATNKGVYWESSDPSIAYFVGDKLYGVAVGTVTVRVTSLGNPALFLERNVFVSDFPPTKILTNNTNIKNGKELVAGISTNLKLTYYGNYSYIDTTFESSNEDCAIVQQDGTIIPLKKVSTTITATCFLDGFEPIIYSVDINVRDVNLYDEIESFQSFVRKVVGHFGAFVLLGFWAYGAFFIIFRKKKYAFMGIFLVGLFVASGTEIVQLFVDGRYGALTDVLLDCAGYYLAVAIILAATGIAGIIKRKRNKLKEVT